MLGLFILLSKQVWKVFVCFGVVVVCVLVDEEYLNFKGYVVLEKYF